MQWYEISETTEIIQNNKILNEAAVVRITPYLHTHS